MGIRFAAYANLFKGIRGPKALVLQGMLIAIIGLILTLSNLNNTTSYLKVTGHLETVYVNLNDANRGSYLKLAGNQELYSAALDEFHPTWDGNFFKGQRADVYFEDREPKVVVAIQLYDQFGQPTQKLTTGPYDQNPVSYHIGLITPQLGIGVLVIGLVIFGIGAVVLIMRKREAAFV